MAYAHSFTVAESLYIHANMAIEPPPPPRPSALPAYGPDLGLKMPECHHRKFFYPKIWRPYYCCQMEQAAGSELG